MKSLLMTWSDAYKLTSSMKKSFSEYKTRRIDDVNVAVFYWSCNKGHYHPTEESARICTMKKARNKRTQKNILWNHEKLLEVKAKRDEGMTYKAIGGSYGVSVERARQVTARAERMYAKNLGIIARSVHNLVEQHYANNSCV